MVFSLRRRWSAKQVMAVAIMVLVLGNLLLLWKMRNHYSCRVYDDQLSEFKYKKGRLEHKLNVSIKVGDSSNNSNTVNAIKNGISS